MAYKRRTVRVNQVEKPKSVGVCPTLHREAFDSREKAEIAGMLAVRNDPYSALYVLPCRDHFHWVRTPKLDLIRVPASRVQV